MNGFTREDLLKRGYVPNGSGGYVKVGSVAAEKPEPTEPIVNAEALKLWESYQGLKSVHRVGQIFGMSGDTVRKKLKKGGYRLNGSKWSVEEIKEVEALYHSEEFNIGNLAKKLGRTFAAIACKADELGLCIDRKGRRRKFSPETLKKMSQAQKALFIENPHSFTDRLPKDGRGFKGRSHPGDRRKMMSDRSKKWHQEHDHPRGMLGKKHSPEVCAIISKANSGKPVSRDRVVQMLKTKIERYGTLSPPRRGTTWKQGWRTVGGQRNFYRSKWEANYARYLEFLRKCGEVASWEHEPETFWFDGVRRGCVSYLPDFLVVTSKGERQYHEVKGWMDAASKTKIRRMRKYHPAVVLIVRDSKWYKSNAPMLSKIVPEWEK